MVGIVVALVILVCLVVVGMMFHGIRTWEE